MLHPWIFEIKKKNQFSNKNFNFRKKKNQFSKKKSIFEKKINFRKKNQFSKKKSIFEKKNKFSKKIQFSIFFSIFYQMNHRFEIKDTRFVDKLPNAKINAMCNLQNCDLWIFFEIFNKKISKTMHPTQKIAGIKTFFHILHLCTKFQSPRFNNIIFKTDLVPIYNFHIILNICWLIIIN